MFRDYYTKYRLMRREKVSDNKGSFVYNEKQDFTEGYISYLAQSEKYFAMQSGSNVMARYYTSDKTINKDDIILDSEGRRFRVVDKIDFHHLYYELSQDNAG